MRNLFRYFNSSPKVIRLTVMMYIRYPLSLRQVEDILFEGGIDICHETVRLWWNRFGPMFMPEIRKRLIDVDANGRTFKSLQNQRASNGGCEPAQAAIITIRVRTKARRVRMVQFAARAWGYR
jgi:hypothetical protein